MINMKAESNDPFYEAEREVNISALSPNIYMMDDYNNIAINKQNDDLEVLAESAERLHNAAITINTELKDQQRLLDELENEMDNSSE
ncbi:hypothetical protein [Plasmodium yoelii yoelii]|uniref:t-SNARE coiled-coil homology domain-containing protein n=1 Tax=Plasmodium yoelii yoelii TaxID=73239 RepID=Q7RE89_PLAYO|nr:hypothetical protein [Plasmodium yoelii yoelii]